MSGPTLVHLRIRTGTMRNLGRPGVSPVETAGRLMRHLARQVQDPQTDRIPLPGTPLPNS